ncbi:hypothetical protein SAMN05421636_109137 [Pricia antarctica]|uniref:Uncharacterized protein n=1 Tax=Pricia antarctica TaxID=641691 RepID=A0A1G7HED2_9FLAO|nr:hypothetical protein [Pricia antarctica]SDE98837.1 hypothetical protein SAMN05421636_109137 [Pricia antarctica]
MSEQVVALEQIVGIDVYKKVLSATARGTGFDLLLKKEYSNVIQTICPKHCFSI